MQTQTAFRFAPSAMRHIITVLDVLTIYPHRKKSYAYKLLQSIRDCTSKKAVTVADLSEYTGFTELEIRAMMGAAQTNSTDSTGQG